MEVRLYDPRVDSGPEITEGKGVGIRIVAYLIDYVIIMVNTLFVGLVIVIVVGIFFLLTAEEEPVPGEISMVSQILLSVILSVGYFGMFEWLYSATPGKLITKMRVVSRNGSRCSMYQAFGRGLMRFIDLLFFGLPAIFSMNQSPLKQRLGDRAANTVVVEAGHPAIKETPGHIYFLIAGVVFQFVVVGVIGIQIFLMF